MNTNSLFYRRAFVQALTVGDVAAAEALRARLEVNEALVDEAVFEAVWNGQVDSLNFLHRCCDLPPSSFQGRLSSAVERGHTEVVRWILAHYSFEIPQRDVFESLHRLDPVNGWPHGAVVWQDIFSCLMPHATKDNVANEFEWTVQYGDANMIERLHPYLDQPNVWRTPRNGVGYDLFMAVLACHVLHDTPDDLNANATWLEVRHPEALEKLLAHLDYGAVCERLTHDNWTRDGEKLSAQLLARERFLGDWRDEQLRQQQLVENLNRAVAGERFASTRKL